MAMVIVFGMFFLNRGEITMVNLLIMYLYQNDVFSLMSEISNFRTSIKDFNSIMNKIVMLGDYKKFEKEKYGKVVVPRVKGKIKFDNVHFGYDEGKNVLNGMSFEINEKESVALVGTPECGKSTIVNLLMRSYDSHSGSITIDDVAIENFDETSLKNNISVVNQDSYIFNMSIKDNLLLVKSDATKSEIDFVCKKADIYNTNK
jgi:ATP-binding cassette subfamily B protein